jgi:hypothetical protein
MTDAQPESKNVSIDFTTGQTITVMRGKTRGKTAEVIAVDTTNKTYAVRYADGTLGTVNAVNVKAPAEDTIVEAKLAAEIQTAVNDAGGDGGWATIESLQALVSRLSSDLPGLGARISWPVSDGQ